MIKRILNRIIEYYFLRKRMNCDNYCANCNVFTRCLNIYTKDRKEQEECIKIQMCSQCKYDQTCNKFRRLIKNT